MERWQLIQRQCLPLEAKVILAEKRIREWVDYYGIFGTYVSFSGGKDSSVLLDICRRVYPSMWAAYCDTGLEYPEVREHVKQTPNVEWLKSKISFREVLQQHGYPIISKEYADYIHRLQRSPDNMAVYNKVINGICVSGKQTKFKLPKKWHYLIDSGIKISADCCGVMKKSPLKAFEKKNKLFPIIGVMAAEGKRREQNYLKDGCNAFNLKRPQSRPLSIWTEQDILQYIVIEKLPIAGCYGEIVPATGQLSLFDVPLLETTLCKRTGCVYCGFGCHLEAKPNRFQRLKITHPRLWEYCMKPMEAGGLGMRPVLLAYGVKIE
jgi:3'-phosphoadenosine 5'-phosphosulfate sulfotransferase (PAPS reductase)/FAD synthetase